MAAGMIEDSIRITLRDDVSNKARQIGTALTGMESKSRTAFSGMERSADRATQSINRTSTAVRNSGAQMLSTVTGIAGVGASFVSLEASMTNIPKRAKAIEMAQVAMARVQDTVAAKNLRLEKLKLRYSKLLAKEKVDNQEIRILEEQMAVTKQQLATYTADLAVKQEDLNLKNADYNDTLKLALRSSRSNQPTK